MSRLPDLSSLRCRVNRRLSTASHGGAIHGQPSTLYRENRKLPNLTATACRLCYAPPAAPPSSKAATLRLRQSSGGRRCRVSNILTLCFQLILRKPSVFGVLQPMPNAVAPSARVLASILRRGRWLGSCFGKKIESTWCQSESDANSSHYHAESQEVAPYVTAVSAAHGGRPVSSFGNYVGATWNSQSMRFYSANICLL